MAASWWKNVDANLGADDRTAFLDSQLPYAARDRQQELFSYNTPWYNYRVDPAYTSTQTLEPGAFTQYPHQTTTSDWRLSASAELYPPMANLDLLVGPVAHLSISDPSRDSSYTSIYTDFRRNEVGHPFEFLSSSASTSASVGGGAKVAPRHSVRSVSPLPPPTPSPYLERSHLDLSGWSAHRLQIASSDNTIERGMVGNRHIPSLDSLNELGVHTVQQEQYKPGRPSSYTANVVKAVLQEPIQFKDLSGRPGILLQTVLASTSFNLDNFLHSARDIVDLGGRTSKYVVIHIKGKQLFKSQIRINGKPLSLANFLLRVAFVMKKMLESPSRDQFCGDIVQDEIGLLGCVNVCKGCWQLVFFTASGSQTAACGPGG